MARKTAQAEQVEAPVLLTLREAAAHLGITEQRVRNLLSTGRIPATKNEKGYWRVTAENLDGYNETKGRTRNGRKQYVLPLSPEQLEALQMWLNTQGYEDVEIKPRYSHDPVKAKAYREARKAKLAAEAAEGQDTVEPGN